MKSSIRHITFILLILLPFVTVAGKNNDDKKFTIVVDAGHGGKDIGASDNGVKEKDINLKVARELESLIKKKLKNAKVVMTRDDDTYLTLQQRADKANKAHGDVFISIHTNSVDKRNPNRKTVAGSSVYTLGLHKDENNLDVAMRENSVIELEKNYEQKYSGFDPQRDESYIIFEMAQKKNLSQSIQLADAIERELVSAGRVDRGVHQAGFWVLWATSMPSVLVELDFICNPESAKYISSDKGAKELSEAIFKAVEKYEESWRKLQSGSQVDLSDTYTAGEENNLEDTYILASADNVTKAKTRSHAPTASSKTSTQAQSGKKGDRKRRSNHSKELSMHQTYEKDDLTYAAGAGVYASASTPEGNFEETVPLTVAQDNSTKKKGKESKKKEKKPKQEKPKKEKKDKKTSKEKREDSHNAKVSKIETVYKIQILASADLLSPENKRFCGLSPITTYKEDNLYKYYYGESTDKAEVEALLATVRKKIPDAFIVTSQKSVKK